MMLKSINPYKNTLIKEYMPYSKDKVNSIINDVSDEFKQWKYLEYSKNFDQILFETIEHQVLLKM